MAAFNTFNQTIADINNGVHNMGSDTFKFMLTNVAPLATNSIKSDLTEIAAGNGYTIGGETLTITSSTQTSGIYSWVGGNSPVFTASGGDMAVFRYVVLYNDTAASKNLVSWYDYGSENTNPDGETFTVNANGVVLIGGVLSA